MKIAASHLRKLASGAKPEVVEAIVESAPTVLPQYGITTPLRLQHFFAQLAHESGGLRVYEENLRYSAKRLTQVWPKRFPTLAAAQPYANNPRKLANKVYGGRMGNRLGTDDGYDFRGRGLIQITGRDGYRKVGFEDNPNSAGEPENFLEVAGRFWQWKGLNALADQDDIEAVTRRVNGGLNGLRDREEYLDKARAIFTSELDDAPSAATEEGDDAKPDMSDPPDLARPAGAQALLSEPKIVSGEVKGDPRLWDVQRRLREMNYPPGALDGAWGGMTAGAIAAFINDRQAAITVPTSLAGFKQIEGQLQDALSEAEAAQWKRPISAVRASMTGAELAPKVGAVKQTIISRFLAKIQAIGAAIVAAFWAAIEWLQSNDHTGPIVDAVQKVPNWAWAASAIVAVTLISGMIWRSQRKAEQAVIDQYREGKLQT